MMGQLSQRTLWVIAGRIPSHPEVQGRHSHKSPVKYCESSDTEHDEKTTFSAGYEVIKLSSLL